jgi:predicted dienelactone hydrolase
VKSWYWKHTHKYRVELPKSVKQVLAIDRNTGNSFWKDAIEKVTTPTTADYHPELDQSKELGPD